MTKEKRKHHQKRPIPLPIYMLIGVMILFAIFTIGYSLGVAVNDEPLLTLQADLTLTEVIKVTRNPMNHVTETVSAIETDWREIKVTQTAITDAFSVLATQEG